VRLAHTSQDQRARKRLISGSSIPAAVAKAGAATVTSKITTPAAMMVAAK
jgi:hypothetical protein